MDSADNFKNIQENELPPNVFYSQQFEGQKLDSKKKQQAPFENQQESQPLLVPYGITTILQNESTLISSELNSSVNTFRIPENDIVRDELMNTVTNNNVTIINREHCKQEEQQKQFTLATVASFSDFINIPQDVLSKFEPLNATQININDRNNKILMNEKQKAGLKQKRFQYEKYIDDENRNDICKEKQKKITSPFAPEATVPLPFQLNEYGFGTTIWKRNERERYRVRCVNEGYERLRSHLPIAEHEKRLSKVDTLRLAIYYIYHLQYLLYEENHIAHCSCFTRFNAERNEIYLTGDNTSSSGSSIE